MNKLSFTLAEVLITLVVIGIISAITVPLIMTNYKKQETISRLKKVYSNLGNWQRLSQIDHGDVILWESAYDIGIENYFNEYVKPYFNIVKVCTTLRECGYKSESPFIGTNKQNIPIAFVQDGTRLAFLTSDGVLYSFLAVNAVTGLSEDGQIRVDINGPQGPNKMGRDIFCFSRTNYNIQPFGYRYKSQINQNCSTTGHGYYCSARLINNNWEFDDTYPW